MLSHTFLLNLGKAPNSSANIESSITAVLNIKLNKASVNILASSEPYLILSINNILA